MATKLKNLKITKVDFVDQGANPDAHIKLFKRKDGTKPEPKGNNPEEKESKEVLFKRFVESAAKMFGITDYDVSATSHSTDEPEDEEPEEQSIAKSSESFKEQLARRKASRIADEVWDLGSILSASFCSILTDDELDEAEAEAAMVESLGEFFDTAKAAISGWAHGKTASILKSIDPTDYEEITKSAYERLGNRIGASTAAEDKKGDHKEMRIDKSKLTESERAFYESIEKRYGIDEGDIPEPPQQAAGGTVPQKPEGTTQTDETVAKALQQLGIKPAEKPETDSDDIFKGLNPVLKSQFEELVKFKEAAEEKELKEIAKRYAILGKSEDELLPVLKSTKKASPEAFDQLITTLDGAADAIKKSGTFGEIGKTGHDGVSFGKSATTTAEAQINKIAKGYMEKDATLTYSNAIAKAWEDNPQLIDQYENEAGM